MIIATHQADLLRHFLLCRLRILRRTCLHPLRRYVRRTAFPSCALVAQALHRHRSIRHLYPQRERGRVQSNGSSHPQRDDRGSLALWHIGLGRPKPTSSNPLSRPLAINPLIPHQMPTVHREPPATMAVPHGHPNPLEKSRIKSRDSLRRNLTRSTSPPADHSHGTATNASITSCVTCCTAKSQPRTVSILLPSQNSRRWREKRSTMQCRECRRKTLSNSNKTTKGDACKKHDKQFPIAQVPVIIMT